MSGKGTPVVTRDGSVLRRCLHCGAWKPKTPEQFGIRYLNYRGDAVLRSYCRPCQNVANRDWQQKHRERWTAYLRQWRAGIPRAEMELPE